MTPHLLDADCTQQGPAKEYTMERGGKITGETSETLLQTGDQDQQQQ